MNAMRNNYLLLGVLLAAALGGVDFARAGDIGMKAVAASPVMPTRPNWLGPYLGLTLGYLGTGMNIGRGAGQSDLELRENAIAIGAIVGHNFAAFGETGSGRWLMGVEADLTRVADGKKKTDPILDTVNMDAAWLGSVRLRGGYATEWMFLYGTVGLGISDIDVHVADQAERKTIRAGLALGLGAEILITENWTARVEGIVYGFSKDKMNITGANRDIETGFVTARFGVARRF